jgi:hypothetical protein
VTVLDGRLKFEESGNVAAGMGVSRQEVRKAEEELEVALRKVYGMVLGNVGVKVVEKTIERDVGVREKEEVLGVPPSLSEVSDQLLATTL